MVSYKGEVKGNTVAYVHRNLYGSENLVSYKGEVKGRVWSLSQFPRPPQSAWTRLERIPHLAVYGECLGKTASSRWHVTSHHFALLAWRRWVTWKGRSTRMKRFSYGERDYAFGQAMLSLRTTIGLTQAGLAVLQHAFPPGREAQEIRALWKAAHQKVLLDEQWLSALLNQPSPPPAPVPVEEAQGAAVVSAPPAAPSSVAQASRPADSPLSVTPAGRKAASARSPRVDWGEALDVPSFYGREGELTTLAQWVVQGRCRVVSVLGMGGIGKSALVTSA